MWMSLIAGLLSAVALLLLYINWQRRESLSRLLVWLPAWALIGVSALLWSLAHGASFGICYAVICVALQAWLVIAGARYRASSGAGQLSGSMLPDVPIRWRGVWQALPRQLVTFVLAVPLAGAAAVFLTGMLTVQLPWHKADLMALGIYAMPLVWGLASYWACADSKRWRPALVFIAIILIGNLL